MRRLHIILIAALALIVSDKAAAQRPVIGERAPEFKAAAWLTEKPAEGRRARLLVFFHSSSRETIDQLAMLDDIAGKYDEKLDVVVIAREAEDKVKPLLLGYGADGEHTAHKYYVALDDAGKTFANFGVQYVPFSVLLDARGRVLWIGNPAQLDDATLTKFVGN